MGEGGTGGKKDTFISKILPFCLGGGSAMVSKTLTAPFERVQIILQTQHLKPPDLRYHGFTDAMRRIPQKEGFISFWRGNATNVARYFPTQALSFAFNDFFQGILITDNEAYSTKSMLFRSMFCGGMAGGCSLMITYPLDFVRTRLSADVGRPGERLYSGFGDALKKSVHKEGFFGLYRGMLASIAMFVPYRGIYFGGYATLKSIFLDPDHNNFFHRWMISQFITTFAQVVVYPLDTVRRRLMLSGEAALRASTPATLTDATSKATPSTNTAAPISATATTPTTKSSTASTTKPTPIYRNTLHCLTTVVREEGVRVLYNGFGVNLLRSVGGGLCLAFYDTLYTMFQKRGY